LKIPFNTVVSLHTSASKAGTDPKDRAKNNDQKWTQQVENAGMHDVNAVYGGG
jgi:hypothetical protein